MIANTPLPPSIELFACSRKKMRLTKAGCARLWESANKHRPDPSWGNAACVACPIGAANAGKPMAAPLLAEAVEAIRPVCPRCLRPALRLIRGRLCVSCYNRDREARIGRNCKGNAPTRLPSRLHVPAVAIVDADGARVLGGQAVSAIEVFITAAKLAKGPLAFSRARLDLERIAAAAASRMAA